MGSGGALGGGAYWVWTQPVSANLETSVKGAEPVRLGVASWGQGLPYGHGAADLGGSMRSCTLKRPSPTGIAVVFLKGLGLAENWLIKIKKCPGGGRARCLISLIRGLISLGH